jgi:HSF-type DNA-binding
MSSDPPLHPDQTFSEASDVDSDQTQSAGVEAAQGEASSSYHDLSLFVPTASDLASVHRGSRRFPHILFRVLERAGVDCYQHIISWQPHGRCFKVHDRLAFKSLLSVLMPDMSQWKSFQQQLRHWGFRRVPIGRDVDGYYHEKFLRYRPHLLSLMRRGRYETRDRSIENADTTPDFYAMPFLIPLGSSNVNSGQAGVDFQSGSPALLAPSMAIPTLTNVARRNIDSVGDYGVHAAVGGGSFSFSGTAGGARIGSGLFVPGFASWLPASAPFAGTRSTFSPILPLRHETSESSDRSTARDLSRGDFMVRHYNHPIDSADDTAGSDTDLEPRPLPPVLNPPGGDAALVRDPVPVARHPDFVQIGPQEFYFSAGGGMDDAQEQNLPSREARLSPTSPHEPSR